MITYGSMKLSFYSNLGLTSSNLGGSSLKVGLGLIYLGGSCFYSFCYTFAYSFLTSSTIVLLYLLKRSLTTSNG